MPELIELKLFASTANNKANNHEFTEVIFGAIKQPEKTNPLLNISFKYFLHFSAIGKWMKVNIKGNEQDHKLYISLSMKGQFVFYSKKEYNENKKFVALAFVRDDGMILGVYHKPSNHIVVYTDSKPPSLSTDPLLHPQAFKDNIIKQLNMTRKDLAVTPICALMLDQKWFPGVGNYLRAEALQRAGIPPFSPASMLSQKSWLNKLMDGLLAVLQELVTNIGDSYDMDSLTKRAWFEDEFLKVYGKSDSFRTKDSSGKKIWWKGPAGELPHEPIKNTAKERVGPFDGWSQPLVSVSLSHKDKQTLQYAVRKNKRGRPRIIRNQKQGRPKLQRPQKNNINAKEKYMYK